MRTTIDLPDELIKRVLYWTGADTKKEAIRSAIEEYVREKAIEGLLALPGTIEIEDVKSEMERIEQESHGIPRNLWRE